MVHCLGDGQILFSPTKLQQQRLPLYLQSVMRPPGVARSELAYGEPELDGTQSQTANRANTATNQPEEMASATSKSHTTLHTSMIATVTQHLNSIRLRPLFFCGTHQLLRQPIGSLTRRLKDTP